MAFARNHLQVMAREAVGNVASPEEQWKDALGIASTIYNRAKATGVSYDDVVAAKAQYSAYGTKLQPGDEQRIKDIFGPAMQYVEENGPVTDATYYATPDAIRNLPVGTVNNGYVTAGHIYRVDPYNRAIIVKGTTAIKPDLRTLQQSIANATIGNDVPVPQMKPDTITAFTEDAATPTTPALDAITAQMNVPAEASVGTGAGMTADASIGALRDQLASSLGTGIAAQRDYVAKPSLPASGNVGAGAEFGASATAMPDLPSQKTGRALGTNVDERMGAPAPAGLGQDIPGYLTTGIMAQPGVMNQSNMGAGAAAQRDYDPATAALAQHAYNAETTLKDMPVSAPVDTSNFDPVRMSGDVGINDQNGEIMQKSVSPMDQLKQALSGSTGLSHSTAYNPANGLSVAQDGITSEQDPGGYDIGNRAATAARASMDNAALVNDIAAPTPMASQDTAISDASKGIADQAAQGQAASREAMMNEAIQKDAARNMMTRMTTAPATSPIKTAVDVPAVAPSVVDPAAATPTTTNIPDAKPVDPVTSVPTSDVQSGISTLNSGYHLSELDGVTMMPNDIPAPATVESAPTEYDPATYNDNTPTPKADVGGSGATTTAATDTRSAAKRLSDSLFSGSTAGSLIGGIGGGIALGPIGALLGGLLGRSIGGKMIGDGVPDESPLKALMGSLMGTQPATAAAPGGVLSSLHQSAYGAPTPIGGGSANVYSVYNGSAPVNSQASTNNGGSVTSLPGGRVAYTNPSGVTTISNADGSGQSADWSGRDYSPVD